MEGPSVKRLDGSRIGDLKSNPNTISKNAIMEAKDTGLLRKEITFHRHATDNRLTKSFILIRSTFLKQLLP